MENLFELFCDFTRLLRHEKRDLKFNAALAVVELVDESCANVLLQKIELERDVLDYPPLQQAILSTVREHGSVDAGLLLRATGANRNTLKDNLRRLVDRGALEKTGQRRGTRYRLAVAE